MKRRDFMKCVTGAAIVPLVPLVNESAAQPTNSMIAAWCVKTGAQMTPLREDNDPTAIYIRRENWPDIAVLFNDGTK